MFCTDLRHRAVTTRVKANVNHLGVGDTLKLLASQGRERVSIATNLGIVDGIACRGIPEAWDTIILIISDIRTYAVCFSLPPHGPRGLVSVPGCYTSTH